MHLRRRLVFVSAAPVSRRVFLRRLSAGVVGAAALGLPARALAAPATPSPTSSPAPARATPTASPAPPAQATPTASPVPSAQATPTANPVPAAQATPTASPAASVQATPSGSGTPVALATSQPSGAATAVPTSVPMAAAWVQALRSVPLWSGPDDAAVQFGAAARWDYFLIARPQTGQRLYVLVARSGNYAWVDALAVGPSGPPPPGWPPADLAPPPDDLSVGWVATASDAALWSDRDGTLLLGLAPAFTAFKQLDPQDGMRLHVQDPYSATDAWLDALAVGPIDPPVRVDPASRWWGLSYVDGANLRPRPSTRGPVLGELSSGRPIVVSGWVEGEEVIKDNPTWAMLSDTTFLYSSVLRPVSLPSAPAPPAAASAQTGRWIDLNLLHQVAVAYEGQAVVRLARTSTGRPGWETTPGRYAIQRRVEKETMESTSLIGLDAQRADYKVENVRWTQYFSADGKALHENYWKPRDEFGIPSSHGCAGLVAEDARFFWDWADIGVPVFAHF